MAASYPAAIWSPAVKTDKVDLVAADHINRLQEEVVAIQTELGADVAGSATDLVARLARALANSGAIAQGTSFPVSPAPVDGQMFYRTDLNAMYIYNGSTWDSQGQSLSNVVFNYVTCGSDHVADQHGVILNDSRLADGVNITRMYWAVEDTTYRKIIAGKFKKVSTFNTVQCYARVWQNSDGNAAKHPDVRVTIGGQTAENSETTPLVDTPTWVGPFNVDVSSLTNGTVYDLSVELKIATGSGDEVYCDSIIGFGA